ncbi:MAG: MBL fold metallo-hydrolase [Armatimonadota bacterium]|nr:MBL fold metallo-hydrolase [Armatimonadota bacterium]
MRAILTIMNIQLAMHSSPRFSTWIWLPEWRLLVDAGDGVTQQLGYKIRKIDTVVLTHAHRDHIGGLLQVVNQRGELGPFAVAHPCGSSSFKMLEAFAVRFNPGTSQNAIWQSLEEGDELPSGIDGRFIKAFRTRHYADDDPEKAPRSLGYRLIWRKQKVRAEYRALPQAELDAVRAQIGREGITEMVDETWVTVGGDGEPLQPSALAGSKLLMHEATFLSPDDYDAEDAGEDVGHVHSTVEEVLRLAKETAVEQVVLYHISTRYTDEEIRGAVRSVARDLQLAARVWVALPRRIYWNLLGERPVWE